MRLVRTLHILPPSILEHHQKLCLFGTYLGKTFVHTSIYPVHLLKKHAASSARSAFAAGSAVYSDKVPYFFEGKIAQLPFCFHR
ncbi:hypothetical protein CLV24_101179 [Pontibacter ummariensis]|uniref:Uncharacterized protein n=1 Tax=Pontibacter ummariensis TaxID=1610492 RepID=A0A239B624_9BACT|nr:hypothetical protein CLV24_101179 [Pontibacter ummariensis]SNS03337.1 hypothetical protein SAMN06296052_101179 [Pontibacter ummariensis]